MTILRSRVDIAMAARSTRFFPRKLSSEVSRRGKLRNPSSSEIVARGILHRDLKPSNLLCVGETLKVVDFGIAAAVGQSSSLAGTLEYMAPEVFMGEGASPASDLFSLGVVACELLGGAYPFSRQSASKFLQGMMRPEDMGRVSASVLQVLEDHLSFARQAAATADAVSPGTDLYKEAGNLDAITPPALRQVVRKLMAQKASDRYTSAEETLEALAQALGEPLAVENQGSRDCFLQAARLIGRDAELEQLESALHAALHGHGSVWLLAGESGVGKSRLIEELRALALIRGARVLRGQAIGRGGQAFQEWAEILRPLCLSTRLSDLEAGVLKSIIGDLAELLEKPIVDAPELDAQAAQQRLSAIIFDVLSRQPAGTVLLFEDAHWSTFECLSLLRSLTGRIRNWPLFVLLSYRDDERMDLLEQLPGSQILKLSRLGTHHVSELSASMLGSAGRNPELIALLERESEGNTFFMIEAIRALVEESGALSTVGRQTLPRNLFVGGVDAMLRRRIERVSSKWQPLLKLAAIIGRQIELDALEKLRKEADTLDDFLHSCAAAAVLEVHEQEWRFSNDKLRESLLETLAQAEQRALHQQVAEVLSGLHPDAENYASRLSFHYQEAGLAKPAAHYAALAGERARQEGALNVAVTQLERALTYYDQVAAPSHLRGRLRRMLAECYSGLGKPDEVLRNGEAAAALLGLSLPRSQPAVLLWVVLGVVRLFWQILLPASRPSCSPDECRRRQELFTWFRTYVQALLWSGQMLKVMALALRFDRLAIGLAVPDIQVVALSGRAYILGMLPLRKLSERFFQEASTALSDTPLHAQLFYQHCRAHSFFLQGKWTGALAASERARLISRERGDLGQERFALLMELLIAFAQGNLQDVEGYLQQLHALQDRGDSPQYVGIFLSSSAQCAFYSGDYAQAAKLAQEAMTLARQEKDYPLELVPMLIQCLAELRAGHHEEAIRMANSLGQCIVAKGIPMNSAPDVYGFALEIFVELWRNDQTQSRKWSGLSRRVIGEIKKYVRMAPICQPRHLLGIGLYDVLSGQRIRGLRRLEQARLIAQQMGMALEEARASFEIGRVLGVEDSSGRQNLNLASEQFRRCGASGYVKLIAAYKDSKIA